MPVEERTLVDIREQMALAALERGAMVTEVAEQFGVSRPTVRLWRDRYRKEGRAGLMDRSHAPGSCPHRTVEELEDLIVEERERWGWGSKKLLKRLSERYPEVEFPPRSTVDAILSRRGLVSMERERRRCSGPRAVSARYEAHEPGELTTIDYKG